jgi:hypothetical protein
MDYKKLIIINLAFLIILGKVLVFIFNKMQKGLKFIDIKNNPDLMKIYSLNSESTEDLNFAKYGENDKFIGSKYNITHLQNFYKEYPKINFNELSNEEIKEIIYKINLINHYVKHVKKQKLKVFLFVLFMIILVNYIATRKFISWANLKIVKEKVREILKRMDKYELLSKEDLNIIPEYLPEESKVEFSTEKLLLKKNN